MQWQFVQVLVLAIPVILLPALLAWYLDISGLRHTVQEALRKRREAAGQVRAAAGDRCRG